MSEVDREAKDQLPKPVLDRVKRNAEAWSLNHNHGPSSYFMDAFEAGALCLAQIIAEVPEGGHPPRLVIEWISDEQKFHARRPLGEKGEGNYIHRSELQALRAKDLLEIERLQNKIKSLQASLANTATLASDFLDGRIK